MCVSSYEEKKTWHCWERLRFRWTCGHHGFIVIVCVRLSVLSLVAWDATAVGIVTIIAVAVHKYNIVAITGRKDQEYSHCCAILWKLKWMCTAYIGINRRSSSQVLHKSRTLGSLQVGVNVSQSCQVWMFQQITNYSPRADCEMLR